MGPRCKDVCQQANIARREKVMRSGIEPATYVYFYIQGKIFLKYP